MYIINWISKEPIYGITKYFFLSGSFDVILLFIQCLLNTCDMSGAV